MWHPESLPTVLVTAVALPRTLLQGMMKQQLGGLLPQVRLWARMDCER